MAAYYNEHDKLAAAWLRELIKARLIADGEVDERSIEDVAPNELTGFTQCHMFAGIGVWSHSLRQAGWPDDRSVWTGSCPCQPFSAEGKRAGFLDERHLWPAFFHLISQCRPNVVFGEQVASNDGLAWLDLVQNDLEGAGYAVGAADICAAGIGAPHIRQRLYWVGYSHSAGLERFAWNGNHSYQSRRFHPNSLGHVATSSIIHTLADADGQSCVESEGLPRPVNGFWADADWIRCFDDKWRAVEPGTFPLADGPSARVGRLRGYGNALVAPVAQAFIRAYIACTVLSFVLGTAALYQAALTPVVRAA